MMPVMVVCLQKRFMYGPHGNDADHAALLSDFIRTCNTSISKKLIKLMVIYQSVQNCVHLWPNRLSLPHTIFQQIECQVTTFPQMQHNVVAECLNMEHSTFIQHKLNNATSTRIYCAISVDKCLFFSHVTEGSFAYIRDYIYELRSKMYFFIEIRV